MTQTVPWRTYPDSRRASRPGLEADARVLAGSCLHGGLLIQADQDGAGRRVQAEAADLPGADSEPGVISAAQPAALDRHPDRHGMGTSLSVRVACDQRDDKLAETGRAGFPPKLSCFPSTGQSRVQLPVCDMSGQRVRVCAARLVQDRVRVGRV
jgi:hypothetical protein